jgi:hypothetical protein
VFQQLFILADLTVFGNKAANIPVFRFYKRILLKTSPKYGKIGKVE